MRRGWKRPRRLKPRRTSRSWAVQHMGAGGHSADHGQTARRIIRGTSSNASSALFVSCFNASKAGLVWKKLRKKQFHWNEDLFIGEKQKMDWDGQIFG